MIVREKIKHNWEGILDVQIEIDKGCESINNLRDHNLKKLKNTEELKSWQWASSNSQFKNAEYLCIA